MKYRRILLKLSGEALSGGTDRLYDDTFLREISSEIAACVDAGVEVAVIVGAGNIWRGRQGGEMDRCTADAMGILATVINAIALSDAFRRAGLRARVMTATLMQPFAELFTPDAARQALGRGEVVIFGGGLGEAWFSTDTAASLRAAQIEADAILLAKTVDGVYDRDPHGPDGQNAQRYKSVSCSRIIGEKLHAIDLTAAALNLESGIPAVAFALSEPRAILRAAEGEEIGTVITPD
ncbi:MAG: uridine monophosphate kinase [Clostridia bacterium]|nr:uridine monophosphate kinase [Clostridia bacterium]